MSDFKANVVSVSTVRLALEKLLAGYESEKAENQRDNDERGIEYWDGACQTIEDVAAELKIALEVEADGE